MRNIFRAFRFCAGKYNEYPIFRELQAHTSRYEDTTNIPTFEFLAAS